MRMHSHLLRLIDYSVSLHFREVVISSALQETSLRSSSHVKLDTPRSAKDEQRQSMYSGGHNAVSQLCLILDSATRMISISCLIASLKLFSPSPAWCCCLGSNQRAKPLPLALRTRTQRTTTATERAINVEVTEQGDQTVQLQYGNDVQAHSQPTSTSTTPNVTLTDLPPICPPPLSPPPTITLSGRSFYSHAVASVDPVIGITQRRASLPRLIHRRQPATIRIPSTVKLRSPFFLKHSSARACLD